MRDESIDVLRSLAIIGIFIAHCNPSPFFIQLRGFDVILMVFLSAVCAKGFDRKDFNYFDFFIKRIYRLVFPVWIFFTLFYLAIYVFDYLPSIQEIISSYALISDSYVWIVRILLILALIAPLIWRLSHNMKPYIVVTFIIIFFILSEILFTSFSNKSLELILMTIPYSMVYLLGLNIRKFSIKQQLWLSGAFLLIFIFMSLYFYFDKNSFILTSLHKYPPRIYYTSYALGISLVLWACRKYILFFFKKIHAKSIMVFIGSHTYWLYLWHIPFVYFLGNRFDPLSRFLIIFIGAYLIVCLQDFLVRRYIKNNKIRIIFNG